MKRKSNHREHGERLIKGLKIDELVKSRHSGLSGILLFQDVTITADSGHAGMTVLRYYRIFYESGNISLFEKHVFFLCVLCALCGEKCILFPAMPGQE